MHSVKLGWEGFYYSYLHIWLHVCAGFGDIKKLYCKCSKQQERENCTSTEWLILWNIGEQDSDYELLTGKVGKFGATAVWLWDKHSFTWPEMIRFSPSQLLSSCVFLTALTSCIPSTASSCSSSSPSFFCWEMEEYNSTTTGYYISVAKTLQCRPMVMIFSAWKCIAVMRTCTGMHFSTWQTHGRFGLLSLLNHGLW